VRALAAIVVWMLATSLASAQEAPSAATELQRALIETWVSVAAMQVRYGPEHPEVREARERMEAQRGSLERELAAGGAIDAQVVRAWLVVQLADVETRLGEVSSRCGAGHPDLRTAERRREALREAIAAIEQRGRLLP
jgi:uncharacterized protein involved in exopolysaccharide biosynthesis